MSEHDVKRVDLGSFARLVRDSTGKCPRRKGHQQPLTLYTAKQFAITPVGMTELGKCSHNMSTGCGCDHNK